MVRLLDEGFPGTVDKKNVNKELIGPNASSLIVLDDS